jgi:hypothetical protein
MIGDVMDDEYSYVVHAMGMATTLGPEDEDDTIRRLHEVIEEITGKPVDKPVKPRMGFL